MHSLEECLILNNKNNTKRVGEINSAFIYFYKHIWNQFIVDNKIDCWKARVESSELICLLFKG